MGSAYPRNLPAGFGGGRRVQHTTADRIPTHILVDGSDVTKPRPTKYGVFVVYDADGAYAINSATVYDKTQKNGGFLVNPGTQACLPDGSYGALNCEVAVMTDGYMDVFMNKGAPTLYGPVYVRIGGTIDEDHVLGGVEGTLTAGETIAIDGVRFECDQTDSLTGSVKIKIAL